MIQCDECGKFYKTKSFKELIWEMEIDRELLNMTPKERFLKELKDGWYIGEQYEEGNSIYCSECVMDLASYCDNCQKPMLKYEITSNPDNCSGISQVSIDEWYCHDCREDPELESKTKEKNNNLFTVIISKKSE